MPVIFIICQSSLTDKICKCDTTKNDEISKNDDPITQNQEFINNLNNIVNDAL